MWNNDAKNDYNRDILRSNCAKHSNDSKKAHTHIQLAHRKKNWNIAFGKIAVDFGCSSRVSFFFSFRDNAHNKFLLTTKIGENTHKMLDRTFSATVKKWR